MSARAHGNYYEPPPPFFPAMINGDISANPSTFIVLITLCLPFFVYAIDTFFTTVFASSDPAGCSKLGLDITSRSGLADQFSSQYEAGSAENKTDSKWRVKALFLYPIKSCAPVELAKAEVAKTGLKFDRVFSFAQRMVEEVEGQQGGVPRWSFITQRTYPRLAHVRCDVWVPDESKPMARAKGARQGWLVVNFPAPLHLDTSSSSAYAMWNRMTIALSNITGLNLSPVPMRHFRVPLEPDSEWIRRNGLPTRPFNIWKEAPDAVELGAMIPKDVLEDLRAFIGVKRPLTLFRIMENKERESFLKAPREEDVGYQPVHGFTDAQSPLHFNNLASVRRIDSLLDPSVGKLDALRFRSNLYMTGPEVYEEDTIKRLRIGTHNFAITAKTTRCTVPTTDEAILGSGEGPKFRQDSVIVEKMMNGHANGHANGNGHAKPKPFIDLHDLADPYMAKKPVLGMQMVPERRTQQALNESWSISVGDELEVLQRGAVGAS